MKANEENKRFKSTISPNKLTTLPSMKTASISQEVMTALVTLDSFTQYWAIAGAATPFTPAQLATRFPTTMAHLAAAITVLLGEVQSEWFDPNLPTIDQIIPKQCIMVMIQQTNLLNVQLEDAKETQEDIDIDTPEALGLAYDALTEQAAKRAKLAKEGCPY